MINIFTYPKGRTYVLVHGAWFGGWVWKLVAQGLRAHGCEVYAPSLTGLGDRKHLLLPGINLDTHTDDIVNLILDEDLEQVVLVGWSYGGMVISNVLSSIPDRVSSVVYLDAFAPERGRSMMSYANGSGDVDKLYQMIIERKNIPPLPFVAMGLEDPNLIEYCGSRVGPHPPMTKLQASKAPVVRPNIPHTYILAGLHLKISTTFKYFYDMFVHEGHADVKIINAGHAMMLTHSEETIKILKNVR